LALPLATARPNPAKRIELREENRNGVENGAEKSVFGADWKGKNQKEAKSQGMGLTTEVWLILAQKNKSQKHGLDRAPGNTSGLFAGQPPGPVAGSARIFNSYGKPV
jgi:hypothetical protein